MKLKKVRIDRGWFGDDKLTGEVEFESGAGHKVEIKLSEKDAGRILEICSGSIATTTVEALKAIKQEASKVLALKHYNEVEEALREELEGGGYG